MPRFPRPNVEAFGSPPQRVSSVPAKMARRASEGFSFATFFLTWILFQPTSHRATGGRICPFGKRQDWRKITSRVSKPPFTSCFSARESLPTKYRPCCRLKFHLFSLRHCVAVSLYPQMPLLTSL